MTWSGGPPALDVTIVAHDIGPVGGMERQLFELIRRLLAKNAHVTVISRTCELDGIIPTRWIRVRGPRRPFVFAYPWFMVAGSVLTRAFRRGLVHATGAIVLNRTDVCTVHLCHQSVRSLHLRRTRGPGVHYATNALAARLLSRLGESIAYRPSRTRRLVAVSLGLADEMRAVFPQLRDRVEVVPNGVDTDRFKPDQVLRDQTRAELAVDEPTLVAVFVGGEWNAKGLGIAIRSLVTASGCVLVVVGSGDIERYQSVAVGVGVETRVHFVGARVDPEHFYAAADVLVLPSLYETFSLVAHEAAAAGLPVIATRVHGVEDLVVDGVSGFFVERTPEDLGRRLAELRDAPELRKRLGDAARTASTAFSWDRMVESYAELYRELSLQAA